MKTLLKLLLLVTCALPLNALADRVPADQIPGNAQWLIHLDTERFRHSTTGARVIQVLIESRALEFGDAVPVNFATVVNGLDSVTLYGTTLNLDSDGPMADGVAILKGSPELIDVFKGAVAALELEKPDLVQVVEESPRRILLLPEYIYGSIVSDRVVAISRSQESLQSFFATLDGDYPSAQGSNLLETLESPNEGFFFAGVAEGINSLQMLPPQARILQMTEGVTLRLGESDSRLNLDLALRTDVEETAVRVHQVLQGVIALASLAQVEHPELQQVLRSIRVASSGRSVRMDLSYPVEEAMKWIDMIMENMDLSVEFTGPN